MRQGQSTGWTLLLGVLVFESCGLRHSIQRNGVEPDESEDAPPPSSRALLWATTPLLMFVMFSLAPMSIYVAHQVSVISLEFLATMVVAVICKGQQYPPIFWRSISESALNMADSLDNSAPLAVLFAADVQQALQFRCFWIFKLLLLGPLLLHLRHTLPPLLSRCISSSGSASTAAQAATPRLASKSGSESDATAQASSPTPSSSNSSATAAPAEPDRTGTVWDRAAQTATDAIASTTGASAAAAANVWGTGVAAASAASSSTLNLPADSQKQVRSAVQQLKATQAVVVAALAAAAGKLSGSLLLWLERLQGTQPQPGTALALRVAALATLVACLVTPFVEPLPDAQDPAGISGMLFSLVKIASLVLELSALKLLAAQCWELARRAATTTTLRIALQRLGVLAAWRAAVEVMWAVGIGSNWVCGITSGWKVVAATCALLISWDVRQGAAVQNHLQGATSRRALWAFAVAAMVINYPVCLPPLDVLPDLAIVTWGSSPIWMGIGA